MAKKQNNAISKLHKDRTTPSQSPTRKSLNTRLINGGKIRSLKSSTVTRSFQAIRAQVTEHKQRMEEPRKSEERYRTILEEMEEGYFETDLAGNLTFINEAGCRNLGYSREELIGKNNRVYADEENAKKVFKAFNKLYRTGEPCRVFDYKITRKDGTKEITELSASLMRNSEGEPIGFRGIARHVTERKKAEEALLNAAQQWRATFDGISDIVCLLDQEGRIVRCNKAMTDLLGKPFGEIINRTHLEIVHGAPMPIEECPVERLWKTHRRETDILLINDRWFSIAVDPLLDEAGRLVGAVHIMSDVTEPKRAEEAIRESEERYRQVIQNAVDIIYTTDANGNFTYANPAALTTTGYSLEELQRFNYLDLILPEHRDGVSKMYISQFRERQATTYVEFPFLNKSGDVLWFGQNASLVIEGENPVGFHVIGRDITERKRAEEALRHSEERYRTILESIEDGYYEEDLAGNFVFFNEAICRIYGYPKEELLGLNYKIYTSKETAKKLFQIFNEMYRTGNPRKEYSYELIRKDGVKRYIEASASLKRDSSGKPIGFRGVVRDVTERKKIEEALRESENKFRGLVENSIVGVYLIQDGLFKYVNPRGAEIHGYKIEEMVDKMGPKQMTLPEDWSIVEESIGKRMRGEEDFIHYEFRIVTKSREIRNVEVFGSRTIYQGRPTVLGTMLDITERKRAEEALRRSEERYRSILESIQDSYFENDLVGNITFVNDVVCRHLGYTREELIGTNFRQHMDEEEAKRFFQNYHNLYRTGIPVEAMQQEVFRKDGTKGIYEVSASLMRDSEGKPIGFRATSRDITERKRAEEERLSLQEQLRQSQKMEAIGQLAGGVAHDFNNLLTVIKGYSQLSLLDVKEDNPLWGNIQEIEKATQRATDLTRQLLAFSRRQILNPKVLDLNALLKDLEKMLRRLIGEDIELVTLLSGDLGKVKVDPSQIEQVIFNLAVNARDAMPSGGKLTIETANVELDEKYAHAHVGVPPGRYVSLSVSDTGVGMTQEVKEKIFDPFFTTKEKGKGTGLGLSMVYGIVKQSNANIWVYSELDRGTTFRIYFPRTDEEVDALHQQEEKDFFPRGSETILLVEDDELVRDLANRLLEQQGYKVLKAANGQEALRVAKEHVGETIHLLLADIVMPYMGGKELADWLKIQRPNIKVLFTSGYADSAIVHHGVLDPGTHFLQKPFSLKTLSHKVREVLDG